MGHHTSIRHMTIRLRLATVALLAAALPSAASAVPIAFQQGAALELDGRWYFTLPGQLVAQGAQGYLLDAPVGFVNCRRAGGQMLVSNDRPFRWNAGSATIWLATTANPDGSDGPRFQYLFDRPILRLRSSTGDLVCEGEVAAPPGLDTLFRWGFE
jgi:hypothetical protein